jgi:hypothetical protein
MVLGFITGSRLAEAAAPDRSTVGRHSAMPAAVS